MTEPNPPIRYEDIEHTSARQLLKLSYRELNHLIRQAERIAHNADTTAHWLRGIKFEKSLRYGGDNERV